MARDLELKLIFRLLDQVGAPMAKVQRDLQRDLAATKTKVEDLGNSSTKIGRNDGPEKLAKKVRGVRDEARQAESAMQRLFSSAQKLGTIAGATAAAGYVLSRPAGKTMDWTVRLAHLSNTAFSARDKAGRDRGIAELNTAVVGAVRTGGGTRDDAADALNALIASGVLSPKDSTALLPTLMRAATASNSSAVDLANIATKATKTFGIKPNEIGRVLDMAITAGQEGNFELKDMAAFLPEQMAAARLSGMSGIGGMAKLLAANQASGITAGGSNQAGNNLVNLLAKLNANDTAKDTEKLGVDLSAELARLRGKGLDGLDAFVAIVDSVVSKDAQFQALQAKLAGAEGGERGAILQSQAAILEGKSVGRVIQDRQAMMALLGIMGNRDYMASVQQKALAGGGATERNFAVISDTAGFKVEQAKNESTIATTSAFDSLSPIIGKVSDALTKLTREFPDLSAAVALSIQVIGAAIAAAGMGAILSKVVGTAGGGVAGAGALARVGGLLSTAGKTLVSGPALAVGAAGAVGYGAGTLINKGLDAAGINPGVALYELINKQPEQKVKVVVDVKNGNIHAQQKKETEKEGRRR